jgi:hypothetical protein
MPDLVGTAVNFANLLLEQVDAIVEHLDRIATALEKEE